MTLVRPITEAGLENYSAIGRILLLICHILILDSHCPNADLLNEKLFLII